MSTVLPGVLALNTWTRIAVRNRWSKDEHPWEDLPEAPLTLKQANALYAEGRLLKALWYNGDRIYVVVKRSQRAAHTFPLAESIIPLAA